MVCYFFSLGMVTDQKVTIANELMTCHIVVLEEADRLTDGFSINVES